MKRLFYYFLVLLLAVWIGLKIAADQGYLLIAYQKATVEMPLWLAVVGVLASFFVLYFLLRVISNIRSIAARLRAWSRARRVRRAWQRTHRGLIALAAGEWRLAENDLQRAASRTDTPILNYLGAARAAQAQGALTRRDAYLGKVRPNGRLPELALGLTQARLQMRQHQYEQALATLQQLHHLAPKHKEVLRLLKQTYLHLEDWSSLEILLPQLEKQDVLKDAKFEALSLTVYQGLLTNTALHNEDGMTLVWQRVPKSLRTEPELLSKYAAVLAKKDPDEAESLLRNAIQKNFDKKLILLYGVITTSHTDKQLQTAEGWLKNQPRDAALLLTLGRLCVKNQLWGKARSYFEASLGVSAQSITCYELAKLLEQLGETSKALIYYRQGLELTQ